jgi:3-hydroxymyristoyl/3-hydroxydecanoyl-(acyl carrier protein) dehydratase
MAQPRRWRFVDTLPVNTQGKATEAMLRALFDAGPALDGHGLPACRWLTFDADSARVLLDITADLAVFDGHFTVAPILPGVAQLDWAVQLAQHHFGLSNAPIRLEAVKFVRPVVPGTALLLQLERHAGRTSQGTVSVHYRLYSVAASGAEVEHASGRLIWTVTGEVVAQEKCV